MPDTFSSLPLQELSLNDLVRLATRLDLIDEVRRDEDRLVLKMGAAELNFSGPEAELYLRGLLRGHTRTLNALVEQPSASVEPGQSSASRERVILLADDDEEDCLLISLAVSRLHPPVQIETVSDGDELLAYLRATSKGERRRPDLVLLDLNMPRKNGWEVLREIRASPDFRSMPIIILSTSSAEQDIARSYGEGSNAFLTKPVSQKDLERVLTATKLFWFGAAQLPE